MNAIIKQSWMDAMEGFSAEQKTEFIIKMINGQLDGNEPDSEDAAVKVALRFAMAELNCESQKVASSESRNLATSQPREFASSDVDISNSIYNNTDSNKDIIDNNTSKKKEKCDMNITSQKKEESCAKEESLSPRDVAEMYNDICQSFPRVIRTYDLGDKRKQQIRLRSRVHSAEEWRQVFTNMENSEFCKTRGFASFDWIIRSETNFQKMLEGNYNRGNIQSAPETVLEKNQRALRELGIDETTILDWEKR